MNYTQVFEHIEKIAATASKNEKQTLVAEGMVHETFKRAMIYAYDPFKTYGVQDLPVGTMDGPCTLEEPHRWNVLDALISRELSGDAAIAAIKQQLDELNEENANLFVRILRKDMRAGFSEGTINKVAPGTIAEFPYMRCSLLSKVDTDNWPWANGVISQEKADGSFANVNRGTAAGDLLVTSRQGSPYPTGCLGIELLMETSLKADTQTHGELTVYEDGVLMTRELGNGVLNSLLSGGKLEPNQRVHFSAWDQIPLSAVKPKGKYAVKYKERLKGLLDQLGHGLDRSLSVIPTRIVRSKAEAFEHYRYLLSLGKEGTVLKNPDMQWKDGTSKDQLKLKLEVDVDLIARAIVPGRAGTKNEGRPGSITCETAEGELVTDVTVKNEAMRDAIEKNPDEFLGRVYAVRANSVLKPGESSDKHSLFLPRFVEASWRTDKVKPDTLAEVKAQFASAAGIAVTAEA